MTPLLSTLTPDNLRAAVAEQYGKVAKTPDAEHPFPVGRAFAESVGYATADLDSLPSSAVASFAGISHPLRYAGLQPGENMLDLGCGAGMDTILAARQVGLAGMIHGLDLSPDMLECARSNMAVAGLANVSFHQSPAEQIPLPDNSMDVVIVNGIFNLCPVKETVMDETFRVLRPGGRMLVSEIVLMDMNDEEWIGESCGLTLEDWFT
jgi:arsenite methyltransferase